jgi:hypothetical protein
MLKHEILTIFRALKKSKVIFYFVGLDVIILFQHVRGWKTGKIVGNWKLIKKGNPILI